MAIRTVDKGGTDWSDGEVLDGADLNDTVDECIGFGHAMTPQAQTEASADNSSIFFDSSDSVAKIKYGTGTLVMGSVREIVSGNTVSAQRDENDGTGTTSDNDTLTISAGEVKSHIIISATINSSTEALGNWNYNVSNDVETAFKIYKTYATVDTDLIAQSSLCRSYWTNWDNGVSTTVGDKNKDFTQLNFIYFPTSDEKTNGFTITCVGYAIVTAADTDGSADATITITNLKISGV